MTNDEIKAAYKQAKDVLSMEASMSGPNYPMGTHKWFVYRTVLLVETLVKHNHMTRDIKPEGMCLACDLFCRKE